ncbi:MAG: hypothetical protein COW72_00415 [Candidatus Nealsonbacteria bacterium CG18_big_fil_WC_8_21_14_2_50_37_10]|uniref:Type II toxin-antitoxin system mRNA interferase toxin, RelE/StbE family n=1 Tax=Candidatus Nealsonbacteria bacterium CG18_big_fil_WC_8_21_14_2_50_37_10 TaxID=1974717 RepID=A0A2H0FL26_9BACT|nr:MAG: hypothetical protein COW72_00415 [Candidatus Nealsonbacteria bacterium CG18_big_fil_WC_8_21_14_2_50_37_10]
MTQKFLKILKEYLVRIQRVFYLQFKIYPQILLGVIFKKMRGEKNVWRRRVGAYRIFYELIQKEKVIHVFWVERRTSKTY